MPVRPSRKLDHRNAKHYKIRAKNFIIAALSERIDRDRICHDRRLGECGLPRCNGSFRTEY